jgi:hypothetical protein
MHARDKKKYHTVTSMPVARMLFWFVDVAKSPKVNPHLVNRPELML